MNKSAIQNDIDKYKLDNWCGLLWIIVFIDVKNHTICLLRLIYNNDIKLPRHGKYLQFISYQE